VCKEIVEGKPFKLVEAVAEKIAEIVLSQFTLVSEVTIKVIKPDPPIPGHYRSVAVEITRRR
jgi:dihydroneopterin aldolase